jgi:hypothetical protein
MELRMVSWSLAHHLAQPFNRLVHVQKQQQQNLDQVHQLNPPLAQTPIKSEHAASSKALLPAEAAAAAEEAEEAAID